MSAPDVACVVLASGLSQRFGGTDKLLADLCGKPVLSHVLETARAVGFGEIFCVSKTDNIVGVASVKNHNPDYGQGHAVRLGLGAARDAGWNICVVMLGDMPLVPASHVRNLIFKIPGNQCVVSVSQSVRMPPAIFNASAIDVILSERSSSGARDLFEQLNPKTLHLDEEAARDVDTPADLANMERIMISREI